MSAPIETICGNRCEFIQQSWVNDGSSAVISGGDTFACANHLIDLSSPDSVRPAELVTFTAGSECPGFRIDFEPERIDAPESFEGGAVPAGYSDCGGDPWVLDPSTADPPLDGATALRSGTTADNAESCVAIRLQGRTQVSWRWRVDSESCCDYLEARLDDVTVRSISGATSWTAQSVWIPAGSHSLEWVYTKDAGAVAGADSGWIDRVEILAEDPLAGWTVDNWGLGDGLDGLAATSLPIGDNETATLSRIFTGPAALHLRADVSSENGYDFLTITLDQTELLTVSGEQRWRSVYTEFPAGDHTLTATYSKDSGATGGDDRARIDAVVFFEGSPLPGWRTGGCGPFLIDPTHGGGALRASACGYTTQKTTVDPVPPSFVELDLIGPTRLVYDWKVSSEAKYDFLRVDVDNMLVDQISGEQAWNADAVRIDEGLHTVRFYYTKDTSADVGQDTGWIDNLAANDNCFTGGFVTSAWIDMGTTVAIDAVWWSATTPPGADVIIRVRTAETSDASTPLWRSCTPVDWGAAPDASCAGPARFAQYRIDLSCALDGEPPVLYGVGLSWD